MAHTTYVDSDGKNHVPVSVAKPLPVTGSFAAAATPPYAATALAGFQQIVLGAGVATLTIPPTATYAVVNCEAVDVRWRDDGTNPTGTVGMQLFAGQTLVVGNPAAFAVIRTAAGAILNVSYYK